MHATSIALWPHSSSFSNFNFKHKYEKTFVLVIYEKLNICSSMLFNFKEVMIKNKYEFSLTYNLL